MVAALCRAGHAVTALVRTPEKAKLVERFGAKAVEGDIKKPGPLIRGWPRSTRWSIRRRRCRRTGGRSTSSGSLRSSSPFPSRKDRPAHLYQRGLGPGKHRGRFVDEIAGTDNSLPMVAWASRG